MEDPSILVPRPTIPNDRLTIPGDPSGWPPTDGVGDEGPDDLAGLRPDERRARRERAAVRAWLADMQWH